MMRNRVLAISVMVLTTCGNVALALTEEASISAKQWPPGFFYQYHRIPIKEKEKILARIEATLKKLNKEGYGLIAKGAVIDKLGTDKKIYDKLTILDESGLTIIARRVPNLYYRYPGASGLNPNIYIIVKNARVNFLDSYIRYGFVVEGDFLAYAHKFVSAIMQNLENIATQEELEPAGPSH
jgi:hypothetical protein